MSDKRLIDANALREHILSFAGMFTDEMGFVISMDAVQNAINFSPTIDAVDVVHGRWLPGVPITCSLCGKPAAEHGSTTAFWLSPYCPWCGQPMDVTDNNVGHKDGGAEG